MSICCCLHVQSIHIAGTKGKGSVAAFISNILRKEGYKVGTYTRYNLHIFFQKKPTKLTSSELTLMTFLIQPTYSNY